MAKSELSAVLVRGSDGLIDQDASLESFVSALRKMASREASDQEAIGPGLAKFWADRPGLRNITFDTLCSLTATSIPGVSAEGFDEVKERIANYVRANTETYYVGKRDGVRLMDRCSPEEKAQIAVNRMVAAKKAEEKAKAANAAAQ